MSKVFAMYKSFIGIGIFGIAFLFTSLIKIIIITRSGLLKKFVTRVFKSYMFSSNRDLYTKGGSLKDYDKTVISMALVKVDFEVYGRVQGVFFRKYTQKQAESLGLRGYCRNTSDGTVSGIMEGERAQVEKMKQWLRETGSPMSRIEKAEFRNENGIEKYTIKKEKFGVERTI